MFFFSPLKRKIESPRRRNSNFHPWVTRLPIEMNVHVVHIFWRLLQIPAFSLLPSKMTISNSSPLQGRRVNRLPCFLYTDHHRILAIPGEPLATFPSPVLYRHRSWQAGGNCEIAAVGDAFLILRPKKRSRRAVVLFRNAQIQRPELWGYLKMDRLWSFIIENPINIWMIWGYPLF